MATAPPLSAVARSYRRTLVLAAAIGLVALVALALSGHPAVGALICAGLGLGAWNSYRVQESYPRVIADGVLNRRAMSGTSLRRLASVTFVVVMLAIAFRPIGWTSAVGLATFQLLLIANTAGPLLREVRRG